MLRFCRQKSTKRRTGNTRRSGIIDAGTWLLCIDHTRPTSHGIDRNLPSVLQTACLSDGGWTESSKVIAVTHLLDLFSKRM